MKSAIPLVVAAVLLAGCGSDDEDTADTVNRPDTGDETAPPAPESTEVFRSDAIAFTFEYPRGLSVMESKRERSVLAEVAVAERSRFNSVKVRLSSEQEVGPERYLKSFQGQFAKDADGDVEAREERIGELDTGVIEFDGSLEELEFHTTSYFFTGAGKTWQLECVSELEHREAVDEVCRTALESLEFPKKRKKPAADAPKQVD